MSSDTTTQPTRRPSEGGAGNDKHTSPRYLHPTAHVGPHVIVGNGVTIMQGAVVCGRVRIDDNVTIGPYASVGMAPEHTAFAFLTPEAEDEAVTADSGAVVIGNGTTIREHVTVHQPTHQRGRTAIGANCYIMAGAHVGHDVIVENNVIMSTGAKIGGHSRLQAWSQYGLNCVVHQHSTVGCFAMVAQGSSAHRDVWPATISIRGICRRVNEHKLRQFVAASYPPELRETALAEMVDDFAALYRDGTIGERNPDHVGLFERIAPSVVDSFRAASTRQRAPVAETIGHTGRRDDDKDNDAAADETRRPQQEE